MFSEVPAFLQPEVDPAVSILPWVVSRGFSHDFLWAASIFIYFKERKQDLGLLANKRSKTPHGAYESPLGAMNASTDAPY
jgi:hypothetical protein